MVSKTLASLDAWLALADEVLKEQKEQLDSAPKPYEDGQLDVPAQLTLFTIESA